MRRLLIACLVVIAVGCADQSDPKRFFPPEDQARQALEAALTAWQQGASPGEVTGRMNPKVMMVDSHHPPNQSLKSFSILGMAPGDGPRVFTVKVVLENPPNELKVRYVVYGVDPIWVVRQEDYDMMSHWSHPMKQDGERK